MGTVSARPSSAARGARPTSSASATGARARTAADELGERRRAVVVHVERHLSPPAVREVEPDGAHARRPAAGLAQLGGDQDRELHVLGVEVDVEGDQRRACGHERGPGGGIDLGRAVVGRELAGRDALGQPRRAAVADRRPLALLGARGELAVEEDGQVVAEERGGREGRGDRRPALRLVEVDDRHDVDRAQRAGAGRGARAGRSGRLPRARPRRATRRSSPCSPASQYTLRPWSGSECTSSTRAGANAAPIASIASRSDPWLTLGTASSCMESASRLGSAWLRSSVG